MSKLIQPCYIGGRQAHFWQKVNIFTEDHCWTWTGAIAPNGYGSFWNGKRRVVAHRFAYELVRGPVPGDMQIDHLCRVRNCVNPDHMEIVTQQENIRRGEAGVHLRSRGKRMVHCINGHKRTEDNLYYRKDGSGTCRICLRDNYVRYHKHRKDQRLKEMNNEDN